MKAAIRRKPRSPVLEKVAAIKVPPTLAKKINFKELPEMFKAGENWGMRHHGWGVVALVNEDGKWVMPPVKCKSYIDDAIACKLEGTTKWGACGYHLEDVPLYKKRLAMVWGFYPGMFNFGLDTLKLGEAWFHKLTGNKFKPFTYTVLQEKMSWYWKNDAGSLVQFDSVLVEYDETLDHLHLMHSLMIACLRSGWPLEVNNCQAVLGVDVRRHLRSRSESKAFVNVQCENDFSVLATPKPERERAFKLMLRYYPSTPEEGLHFLNKQYENGFIHGSGIRDGWRHFVDYLVKKGVSIND